MNSFIKWHDIQMKLGKIITGSLILSLNGRWNHLKIWICIWLDLKKLIVYEDNVFKLKLMVIVFIWTIKSDILFQLSSPKYFDGKDTTLTWKVFGLSGYIFLWVIPYEYLWHRTMLPLDIQIMSSEIYKRQRYENSII